jgi:hypothetical protein
MDRNQLVEKMLKAYRNGGFTSTEGMEAALDVAVEELLGDIITDEEHATATNQGSYALYGKSILAARRARLSKQKTPEERVEVRPAGGGYHEVWLDGQSRDAKFWMYEDARLFRLGLVHRLKESEQK